MISGRRALGRLRVSESGEVIQLEREQLLALIQTDTEMSEILMRAFILRRVELIAHDLGDVIVIGSAHSAETLRAKQFLTRNGHPFHYISSQIVCARSIPSSQRAHPIVTPGLGQGRGQYEGIVDTFV